MKKLLAKIRKILHDRRTRRFLTRFVSGVAALVVFVTTYALVLPAITMEKEANCGIEAHQHDDSCYTEELICDIPESDGHHHDESCYSTTSALVCETEEHEHSAENGCYDDEGNLICEVMEHRHNEECYEEVRKLTCRIPESEGHHHTEDCYEKVLTCGKEVHVHSTACYEDNSVSEAVVAASTSSAAAATTSAGSVSSAGMTLNFEGGIDEVVDFDETVETDKTDDIEFVDNIGSDETNRSSETAGTSEIASSSETKKEAASDSEVTYGSENAGTGHTETSNIALTNADNSATALTSSADTNPYIPQLDAVDFNTILNNHTGIYHYRAADGETVEDSSAIPAEDWNRIPNNIDRMDDDMEDVELGSKDLLRVYLSYTIPAGSLNATNPVARYRLPSNLHLTDPQVKAINENVNGLAGQYVDMSTLEITDPDKYNAYLGVEAVEGTRRPDEAVEDYLAEQARKAGKDADDAAEYISAVVRVENVYDADGLYGEKDAYLGQDLIFTFAPYSIEKNQHEYDSTGKPTKAGEEIKGWFTFDLNMGQVDFEEPEITTSTVEKSDEDSEDDQSEADHGEKEYSADSDSFSDEDKDEEKTERQSGRETEGSQSTVVTIERAERIAEIVFVEEGWDEKDNKIEQISTMLKVVEEKMTQVQEDDAERDTAGNVKANESAADAKAVTAKKETDQAIMPAMSFSDSIRVSTGKPAGIDDNKGGLLTSAAESLPEEAEVFVRVEADEGSFPVGTTMVLRAVDDLDAVAEAVTETVESGNSSESADGKGDRSEQSEEIKNSNSKEEKKNRKTYGFQAVDITFLDADGNEIEPAKPVRVALTSKIVEQVKEEAKGSSVAEPVVVHVDDDGNAEQMDLVDPSEIKPAQGRSEEELLEITSETETAEGDGKQNDTETADTSSTVEVQADSFSVYAIVYTVDFHWEVDGKNYEFSLPGGGFVSFAKLIEVLGVVENDMQSNLGNNSAKVQEEDKLSESLLTLDDVQVSDKTKEFVADVEKVQFSDSDLVWVSKVDKESTVGVLKKESGLDVEYSKELMEDQIEEINAQTVEAGDWALISVHPFLGKECLTVIMKDGDVFTIHVTDAQIKKTVISASGDTYEVTVTYGEDAEIPDGADLIVNEITDEDDRYETLWSQTENCLDSYNDNGDQQLFINRAMFLDIKIVADGREVEPQTPVAVSITKKNDTLSPIMETADGKSIMPSQKIVHFIKNKAPVLVDDVTVLEQEKGIESRFLTESFSDFGAVKAGTFRIIGKGDTLTLNGNLTGGVWTVDPSGLFTTTTSGDGKSMQLTAGQTTGIALFTHTGETGEKEYFKIRISDETGTPPTIPTVTNQAANIVRMRLIDFDESQILDDEHNSGPNNYYPQSISQKGINYRHRLKFLGWGYSPDTNDGINTYAEHNGNAYSPVQNILEKKLENGYPVVAQKGTLGRESLKYLFDENGITGTNDSGTNGKKDKTVYENVDGLFRLTTDGYYEYNSNTNYAHYDGATNSFSVYDRTYYQQASTPKAVGFFPFNEVTDAYYPPNSQNPTNVVGVNTSLQTGYNDYLYLNPDRGARGQYNSGGNKAGYWNHHLGLNMAVDFNIDFDGLTNGKDTIFKFNGDDDMWVFVDGRLLLDIGGLHQPIDGEINFKTGAVTIQGVSGTTNIYGTNPENSLIWEDFVGLDKPHRLEIFYLERGGCDSNCKISFNLAEKPPEFGTVHFKKIAPNMVTVEGAEFQFFLDEDCTIPLKKAVPEQPAIIAGFNQGQYDYEKDFIKATSGPNGVVRFPKVLTGTYFMKETKAPEGYLYDNTVYKVVIEKDDRAGSTTFDDAVPDNTTIYKLGSDTPLVPMDGIENPRAILKIKKTDPSGIGLQDAEFRLAYTPASGSTHSAVTKTGIKTDATGYLILDATKFLPENEWYDSDGDVLGLPDGSYVITETTPPEGYVLSSAPTVSFSLKDGQLTRADGVAYDMEDENTLVFNIVNSPEPGKLRVQKIWLNPDESPETNHPGTLSLTLKQWEPKAPPQRTVDVTFYCTGDGNDDNLNGMSYPGQRTSVTSTQATGSGDLNITWNYNPSTSPSNVQIQIYDNNWSVIHCDLNKGTQQGGSGSAVIHNYEGSSVNVLMMNSGWRGYTYNSTVGSAVFTGGGSVVGFEDNPVSQRTITLRSQDDWKQIFTLSGTGKVENTTGNTIPAKYNNKDAYYTIVEGSIEGYVLVPEMSSGSDPVKEGILRLTNKSTKSSMRLKKDVTIFDYPLSPEREVDDTLADGFYTFTISGKAGTDTAGKNYTVVIEISHGTAVSATVQEGDSQASSVSLVDGTVELKNLTPGEYTIEEISHGTTHCTGIESNNSSMEAVVDLDSCSINVVLAPGASSESQIITFTNNYKEADINFKKIDENNALLAGAMFDLRVNVSNIFQPVTGDTVPQVYSRIRFNSGKMGEADMELGQVTIGTYTYKATFTTPSYTDTERMGDPLMTLKNLPDGDYQLIEVKAPDGYVLTLKPIGFKVENGVVSYLSDDTNNTANGTKVTFNSADDNALALLTAQNEPGVALPNTGGSGISLIYFIGIMLTGLAGVGLVMKKRRKTT